MCAWGAAIGAGVQALHSTLNTGLTAMYNAEEARKQRNWQEKMSNTAHQREVKDLRLAGLNPILSATGGSGASSPSGGTASIGVGATPDYADIYRAYKSEKELRDSQLVLNRATEGKIFDERERIVIDNAIQEEALKRARVETQMFPSMLQSQIAANLASVTGSKAAVKSADAAYINATQGNWQKYLLDFLENQKHIKNAKHWLQRL